MPVGLRSRVPAKITSCMLTPRSERADCSPSTHEMASEMFDLPQPFGPTIAAMPSPRNFNSVRSQNDLNPRICSFFSLSNLYSLFRAMLQSCRIPSMADSIRRHKSHRRPIKNLSGAQNAQMRGPIVDARATLLANPVGVKLESPIFWVFFVETPLYCTSLVA